MRSSTPRRWTRPGSLRSAAPVALVLAACGAAGHATDLPTQASLAADATRPGGGATVVRRDDRRAFAAPAANLAPTDELAFLDGHALFEKIWVAAPTSTLATDGLGPFYNARACTSCHLNNGRGRPPAAGETPVSLVVHAAVPGAGATGIEGWRATRPDPIYGRQIQTFATIGLAPEAQATVRWQPVPVTLGDGSQVALRRPEIVLDGLAHGPLAPGAMLSPRIAPPMIGLGLLEAIPAAEILAREDPGDADGDGISGRANLLPRDGTAALGRFGWKAGHATVADQAALAFATDIGISTPDFPAPWGDCTEAQTACRTAPHGDGDVRVFEADRAALDAVTFYASHLGVPARGDTRDPQVRAGQDLFREAGCVTCHTPSYASGAGGERIWPYTDLLLHDMGPGLDDGFTEGRAGGAEWRTPPLWAIGLTPAVSGETSYLHDGRARTLIEAILWHGGEATAARDAVAAMPAGDRDALIRFLESL